MKYQTLYERLVANTRLAEPDNAQSCWLWTGHARDYYPKVCVRNMHGQPRNVYAHRLMLEEVLDCTFPFDEAGHLCGNPRCINPDHLEVQTHVHNVHEQARYRSKPNNSNKSWIPVLFPRNHDA